jgi:GTP-binding protein EngB required for normal cell division
MSSTQAQAPLPLTLRRRRSVLLFGKSQVGKSHICNMLLQRPGTFQEGRHIASCTLKPHEEVMLVYDEKLNMEYEVTVMDLPGMFDSRTAADNETLLGYVTDYLRYNSENVSKIFYVFKMGSVSSEEVDCIELMKGMLTDNAVTAGLCSMVVTFCDGMDSAARRQAIQDLKQSNFAAYMPMFTLAGRNNGQPEIIPIDFSPQSTTSTADRQLLVDTILQTPTSLSKNQVFRVFQTLELQERKKIRDAWVASVNAKYRQQRADGKSTCPQQ